MKKVFLTVLILGCSISVFADDPVVTFCSTLLKKQIEGVVSGTNNQGKVITDHIKFTTGKSLSCQYAPQQQYEVCTMGGKVSIKQPSSFLDFGNSTTEWGTPNVLSCGNFDPLGTHGMGIKIESTGLNLMLTVVGTNKAMINRKFSGTAGYNLMNWQDAQNPGIDYFNAGIFSWTTP